MGSGVTVKYKDWSLEAPTVDEMKRLLSFLWPFQGFIVIAKPPEHLSEEGRRRWEAGERSNAAAIEPEQEPA